MDFFRPVRDDDGVLALHLPMADRRLPAIAAEDIGRTAFGVFERGPELVGRTISISGENLSGEEYAAAFAKELGQDVAYRPVTVEAVRAQGSRAPTTWPTCTSTTPNTSPSSPARATRKPCAS
ncbi:MAG: hypothetical protein QOI78_2014 [Actinomycetota bacterium]|nr:hypothetical protein [Actinomycetota bacterium]